MLSYINRLLRERKGQAMVELTIAVPTLAVFFSAILFFGRGLNAKISIRNATRHAAFADGRPDRSGSITKSKMYGQFFLNKDRNKETLEDRFTYTKGTEDKGWIAAEMVAFYGSAALFADGPRLVHVAALAALEVSDALNGANTATCEYRVGRTSLFGKIMSGLSSKNYTTRCKLWVDYEPAKIGKWWILAAAAIWADPFHVWGGFEWDFSSLTMGSYDPDYSWWDKCYEVVGVI